MRVNDPHQVSLLPLNQLDYVDVNDCSNLTK